MAGGPDVEVVKDADGEVRAHPQGAYFGAQGYVTCLGMGLLTCTH